MANEVKVVISAEDKATQAIQQVKDNIGGVEKSLTDVGNRMKDVGEAVSSVGKTMAVAGGALFGAVALVSKASLNAQTAWLRVESRVRVAGLSIQESVPRIKAFATEIQNATGMSDELVGEFTARLLPVTKDIDLAFRGTKAAIAMAAHTGRDLNSMQMIMQMVMSGNIEMLGRYVPAIRDLNAEQLRTMTTGEKVAIGLREIEKLYGGIADVPVDPIMAFREALSDLFEEIGLGREDIVRYSEVAREHINQIREWVVQNQGLVRGVVKFGAIIGGAIMILGSFIFVIGKVIAIYGGLLIKLANVKKVLKALTLAKAAAILVWGALIVAIGLVIKELYEFGREVGGMGRAWQLTLLHMRERFLSFVLAVAEGINRVAGKIPGLKNVSADVLNWLRNATAEVRNEFDRLAVEGIQKAQEEQQKLNTEFSEIDKSIEELLAKLPQYGKVAEEAGQQANKAFEEQVATIRDLRQEIRDIYDEIRKAHEEYHREGEREEGAFRGRVGDIVARAKTDIINLERRRFEAMAEGNIREVNRLNEQIAEKQRIVSTYQSWNINLEGYIAERKRYLAMNELEQLKFDHEKKRLMRQAEFLKEEIERTKNLIARQTMLNTALDMIGQERAAAINAEIEKSRTFRERLEDKAKGLRSWVEESVGMYQEYVRRVNLLMTQIRTFAPVLAPVPVGRIPGRQMGGFITETGPYLLHKGEKVIPSHRAGAGAITVNILGGNYLSEDAAEKIGDLIIRRLKDNLRL